MRLLEEGGYGDQPAPIGGAVQGPPTTARVMGRGQRAPQKNRGERYKPRLKTGGGDVSVLLFNDGLLVKKLLKMLDINVRGKMR